MNSKRTVFYSSLAISLALISVGVLAPEKLESFSNNSLEFIYNNLGWFILASVFFFLLFACILASQSSGISG